jgi:uncharacterized membrane protein
MGARRGSAWEDANMVIRMKEFTEPQGVGAPTRVAILDHPIHPTSVHFPIAFLLGGLAADGAFLYLGDPFWARMALWLIGAGTVTGVLAGIVGTAELLLVRGIRRRAAAWNHFVAAVMMLAVAFANWMWRLPDHEAAVWPWGFAMSVLGAVLVAIAGALGGSLVYEHQIGIAEEDDGD